MRDFDDDPLGDLLSEGSSDSFFDDPKTKLKNTNTKKEVGKDAISQLFGIDTEEKLESNVKKDDDWLSTLSPKKEKPEDPVFKRKPVKKVSFDDDADIFEALRLDNAEPSPAEDKGKQETKETDNKKKSAVLDDIFGTKTQRTKPDFFKEDTPKAASNKISEPEPIKDTGFSLSGFSRETRRPRSGTSRILDPLGLLSTEPNKDSQFSSPVKRSDVKQHEEPSKPTPSEDTKMEVILPAQKRPEIRSPLSTKRVPWLDEDPSMKLNKSESAVPPQTNIISVPSVESSQVQKSSVEMISNPQNTEASKTTLQQNETSKNIESEYSVTSSFFNQGTGSQSGYQNAYLALQQQESMLMIALQMKKYEENLDQLHKKQQEMIDKQEQYFKSLLQQQVLKQHSIDRDLQLQQEKIHRHIETLLLQSVDSRKFVKNEENLKEETQEEDEMVKLLKQKQREEVFIVEESYKKQIFLLEETLKAVEDRLKKEIEDLSSSYDNTIKNLNSQHRAELERYENKLREMTVIHENEIKALRENNNRVVEDIRNEFAEMVNTIKRGKQIEQRAFEDSASYMEKLDRNIDILTANSEEINEIKCKLEEKYSALSKTREETIRAKEKEIEMMKAALEKTKEASDAERAQLMAVVRNLEIKLAEQSQNSREDRWAFQQAAANLTARMSALDREAEFQRSAIEREREQLKTLKETLLAEQEKLMLELTEEKLAIAAEKSRLQASAKLNNSFDFQKAQAEVEAAVNVAKEAAERTDRERENLIRAQYELETFKRNLRDREQVLTLKEKSLEAAKRETEVKSKEAERTMMEAKLLETTYNGRMRDMHSQLAALALREKKIAEEKMMLSKERLALKLDLQQVKRCTLCTNMKISENLMDEFEDRFHSNMMDSDNAKFQIEANEENKSISTVEDHADD